MLRNVVDAGNHPRCKARPVDIKDANRPESRAGGDTDNADTVIERSDCAGDVGAVTVAVGALAVIAGGGQPENNREQIEIDAVGSSEYVQVRVCFVDAGVDNGDIDIDATVVSVNGGNAVQRRTDALHARGCRLRQGPHEEVGFDQNDVGIILNLGKPSGRDHRGKAPDGRAIDRADTQSMLACHPLGQDNRIAPRTKLDDVAVRHGFGSPGKRAKRSLSKYLGGGDKQDRNQRRPCDEYCVARFSGIMRDANGLHSPYLRVGNHQGRDSSRRILPGDMPARNRTKVPSSLPHPEGVLRV